MSELTDHALQKSHARHISKDGAISLGLKVTSLEDNHALQEAVLSVHHAAVLTMTDTPATKIIENHLGSAFINRVEPVVVQGPTQQG